MLIIIVTQNTEVDQKLTILIMLINNFKIYYNHQILLIKTICQLRRKDCCLMTCRFFQKIILKILQINKDIIS